MERFLEKKTRKYVIATLDLPTQYLKKVPAKPEYSFVEDIEIATKAKTAAVAEQIKNYFYTDTHLNDIKLVVIPIEITYEIIDDRE